MIIQDVHIRRKKMRLKGYDYSQDNLYYITICTYGHENCFGIIRDCKMEINECGQIADDQFKWLQQQYSYIKIPVWIIMPDHVHAIIEIDGGSIRSDNNGRVRSRPDPTENPENPENPEKIKPLPELIGAYKTTTSKKIHQSGLKHFQWQRSYHDHIIRNSTEYTRINRYIEDNPLNFNSEKPGM